MIYFLQGDRVGLRPLRPGDVEGPYVDWFNDAEVCRFNSHHVFPMTRGQAAQFIEDSTTDKSRLVLAVELPESRLHIGNISLHRINRVDRNAEFAVLMGEKSAWGHGYAKEAGRLLVLHGFRSLNLHRIYCGTNADNVPMQRLAASLGMTTEGRYRQAQFKEGRYVDVLRYAVLRSSFEEQFFQGAQ